MVIDLPALVDRFATEFDALPEIIEGLPSARMLISIGRLVSRVVVYGREAPDGTIDLIGTTSIFRTEVAWDATSFENRSGPWMTQPTVDSDADLVAAICDGDRRALETLYRRHAPWLVLRLSHRCADSGLVDEALQDTFVTVWKKAGTWTGEGEVAAWIWGISIRTLMSRLRPRAPLMARLASRRSEPFESTEDLVLTGIQHGALGPAIDGLSPDLRSVVQATVLDGLTTREAGRLLGIPSGTVKTRMRRARLELREALA